MSTPMNVKAIHDSFIEAFNEAYKVYFNDQTLDGALLVPQSVPTPEGLSTHIFATEPIMRQTDVIAGHGPQRIRDAVKALFVQVANSPVRKDGWVPVFRTRGQIECGGLMMDKLCWQVGIWCDMTWAPPDTDFGGLTPAWES